MIVEGREICHLGSTAACAGAVDAVITGAVSVLANGLPISSVGSATVHGGVVASGARQVLVGGGETGPAGLRVATDGGRLWLGFCICIEHDERHPDFQAIVARRIAIISSTQSGSDRLKSIDSSGQLVEIVHADNSERQSSQTVFNTVDATKRGTLVLNSNGISYPTVNGEPVIRYGTGKGTGSVVHLQPDQTLKNPNAPGNPVPVDTTLYHELGHAEAAAHGTVDHAPTGDGFVNLHEREVIDSGPGSEARYLKERGYDYKRNSHSENDFVPQ